MRSATTEKVANTPSIEQVEGKMVDFLHKDMSEELQARYQDGVKITGQRFGEFEYFVIGATTFNQLKQAKLIAGSYSKEYSQCKPDRILIDRRNKLKSKVVVVIEDKKNGKFKSNNEKLEAIRQCNNYCQELDSRFGVITDGVTTVWINPHEPSSENDYIDELTKHTRSFSLIKDENGGSLTREFFIENNNGELADSSKMTDRNREIYTLINKISTSIDGTNSQIRELPAIDPLELATRVWQDIWVATGKSPEKCLYNVVELFIFKFLSDLGVLTESFDELYRRIERGDKSKDVLTYYVKSCRDEILKKFKKGDDQTTIINGTIFVNETGEPNLSQAHLFVSTIKKFKDFEKRNGKFSNKNIDKKFKTELYEKFLKQTSGLKALGQFFTPRKVVQAIVKMAESDIKALDNGDILCDPFCGVGGFVLEPINLVRKNDFEPVNGKIKPPVKYLGFDKGFEKDEERTIILAKANMLIYLADIINKGNLPTQELADTFNNTFRLWQTNLGTLGQTEYQNKIKLILTNPPYVTSGSSTLKDEIAQDTELQKFYSINAGGVEGLALEWIVRSLSAGGKAYVVIPDGILNRINDKKFRKFLLDECYLEAIISLPIKTFFTTPKKTYILVIEKKQDKHIKQKFPVFTYLVSNIGETLDVKRFEIKENDLYEAVSLFNQYKGLKENGDVGKILEGQSKRCKIQPIEKFDPERHWSVDRWWNREEKIALGIEDEVQEIQVEEFINNINSTVDELRNLAIQSSEILKKKSKEEARKFVSISLGDTAYFNTAIGERLLKRDLFQNDSNPKAVIPAYSANVFKPFGYVEESNITRLENPYILWGIDGDFDLTYIERGSKFASTDHCGTIEILNKKINPEYLLFALNLKKYEYGFDRGLRSNLVNVRRVEISIPLDEEGGFDMAEQEVLVKRLSKLHSVQKRIEELKDELEKATVVLVNEYENKEVDLRTILNPIRGDSKYTKKYGNEHRGEYPVYSASNEDLLTSIDKYDYDGRYLTWATNGFGGYMKLIEGRFSINADRGILIPMSDDIDIDYIKYVLQPKLREVAKGRLGDRGKNEFTKVNLSMFNDIKIKMPILADGSFDLLTQKEIAGKYRQLDNLKDDLSQRLQNLSQVKISLS